MATNNAVNTSFAGQTGTGAFVGSISPTITTPILGIAAATSIALNGGTALGTYLEGSFIPSGTFSTPGDLSLGGVTASGRYTRIGDVAIVRFRYAFTPTYTTSSGNFAFTNMPYAVSASAGTSGGSITNQTAGLTYSAGRTMITPAANPSTTEIIIRQLGSAVAHANTTTANIPSGVAQDFIGSLFYFI